MGAPPSAIDRQAGTYLHACDCSIRLQQGKARPNAGSLDTSRFFYRAVSNTTRRAGFPAPTQSTWYGGCRLFCKQGLVGGSRVDQ
jgi:hypothetical protein